MTVTDDAAATTGQDIVLELVERCLSDCCLAFSSGHVSTVDSVPSGAIRTTCHPMALASYRSRFILRICAPSGRFSTPPGCHNQTDPLPSVDRAGRRG